MRLCRTFGPSAFNVRVDSAVTSPRHGVRGHKHGRLAGKRAESAGIGDASADPQVCENMMMDNKWIQK